jgi:hypothetical protein
MNETGRALFAQEAVVMSTLQSYATAYTNYEECNSLAPALVGTVTTRLGIGACTGAGAGSASTLNAAYAAANTALIDLAAAKASYMSAGKTKTNAEFDASMVALKSDYASMSAKRANLDTKLRNLYNAENSIADMNKVELDAEIYANILWTILATTLLYVVFTRL